MATQAVQELPTLPDGVRPLTSLASTAGYTDTFLTDIPVAERSAEDSGQVLEQAPAPLRAPLPAGWATLGLRHGPLDSADHVLGWPIRDHTHKHMLLGAESRIGMPAELLFAHWDGALLIATLIRFEYPAMRVLWLGIEPLHKRTVRTLLTQAAHTVA